MKKWVRPLGRVEQFEANDYIAACYKVSCSIGSGDSNYSKPATNEWGQIISGTYVSNGSSPGVSGWMNDNGLWHGSTCANQTVLNDNGSVYEYGKASTGGRLAVSGNLRDYVGKYVAWTTAEGSNVYYHFGVLQNVDAGHPNMS